MTVALLTNFPTPYRVPLYERLAARDDVEVVCYGGGDRYVPDWLRADLDTDLVDLPFPARRLAPDGARTAAVLAAAFMLSAAHEAVITPYAGGPILPAAYLGARRNRTPFLLWASVWAQPWSVTNAAALPVTLSMYRHADAVIAYGAHVKRFVARRRGHDDDVFVAPQSVEAELFGRAVSQTEIDTYRDNNDLGTGPLVVYVGRLVEEKGVGVLLDAWPNVNRQATLAVIGDGPLAERCSSSPGVRLLGPLPREDLPVAYAAAVCSVLASTPTRRFREPWGLVCNEAMHQGRPVVATTAVGAAAGGLVRNNETGLVVAPNDPEALQQAITTLLDDRELTRRLGENARTAVTAYTYEAMTAAFEQALAVARRR